MLRDRYDKWITGWKEGEGSEIYTGWKDAQEALRLGKSAIEPGMCLWGDMSMVGNPAPSLPEFMEYSALSQKESIV